MSQIHTWSVDLISAALSFTGVPTSFSKERKIYDMISITSIVHNPGTPKPCVKLQYNFYNWDTTMVYGQCYSPGKAVPTGDTTYTNYFKFVNPAEEKLVALGDASDPFCIKMPANSAEWNDVIGCKVYIDEMTGSPPACSGANNFVNVEYVVWGTPPSDSYTLSLWGSRAEIDATTIYAGDAGNPGPFIEGSNYNIVHLHMKNTGRCPSTGCSGMGGLHWKVRQFIDAAQGGESIPLNCTGNGDGNTGTLPGETASLDITGTAPQLIYSEEKWYLGVKVWSPSDEMEPTTWTLNYQSLDNKILYGLLAIGGLAALLWYTKKKKMW